MVKCSDCKNLGKVYLQSAFSRFGEQKICKVKNIAFNGYEIEKERDCETVIFLQALFVFFSLNTHLENI